MTHPRLDRTSLAAAYASGTLTPSRLVDALASSLEASDALSIWIHRRASDALRADAQSIEREKDPSLPLWGVPFAVKDNIDVAGIQTTAACPDFAYTPASSSPIVDRLLEAGALLVGKTNLDQFATGLVGVRSPYGVPTNPFDPRYITGGSSSGSAAAVARGLVTFALGTDTAGSGRVPASFTNTVGLKPSPGLLSTRGVVPACRSLDCVSIFALTVGDAIHVAQHTAFFDALDPYSRRDAERAMRRDVAAPSAFRFGVPAQNDREFFGDREAEAAFDRGVERLQALGGEPIAIDLEPFLRAARLLYEGPWIAERLGASKSSSRDDPRRSSTSHARSCSAARA
jgi:allophanate hydrolase